MITAEIENELLSKLPRLTSAFKSKSNVLTFLKEIHNIPLGVPKSKLDANSYFKLINHIKLLIDFQDNLFLVSPWDITFNLLNISNNTQIKKDVDFNEPYKVFTLEGDLLYSVYSHKGFFGTSELDKWLIQKSKNMSTYLLEYKDVKGESNIIVLIISIFSSNTFSSNPYYNPPTELIKSDVLTIENNTEEVVKLFTLFEEPTINFSPTNIKLNGEEVLIGPYNQHIVNNNSSSFWLLFEKNQNVLLTDYEKLSESLIIPVIFNSLYYVAINTSSTKLNTLFNTQIPLNKVFKNQTLKLIK